jgi:integrase
LKTFSFSVAQARLSKFLREHRERSSIPEAVDSNRTTFSEALSLHLKRQKDDTTLKPATKHYWKQIFAALVKSWPELSETEIRKITPSDCKAWALRFLKKSSPTRFNNTICGLSHVFKVAIEGGIIYQNPAEAIERVRIRPKHLVLPSNGDFLRLVNVIAGAGAWCSRDCSDYVQVLAFTGMRKGEAAHIEWKDIDLRSGEIIVRGDPETGTKNWEVRRVPLIPAARALFERMRSERNEESPSERVLRVNEAQKAIDTACKKLGIQRFTHHDLRHLFATTCIESGVDIPTISRWLGHKDGGALAMKTYGHLRREHSLASAQKVRFGIP